MTASEEIPLTITCGRDQLIGILHRPEHTRPRGVVLVVGAPQYRTGSHRQFVLLARHLADAGYPVLRFDYRGMGDSEGDFVGFEGVKEDIKAAVDCLFAQIEGLRDVALWGLCDGASAASFYATDDPRVSGLVLLNPWVRTETTVARTRIKGYYAARLITRAFWAKLARGELDLAGSTRDFLRSLSVGAARFGTGDQSLSLPQRVASALRQFDKPILLILSGADLTAQEFETTVLESRAMRSWRQRPGLTVKRLEGANHTYSTKTWREQVHAWTLEWLSSYLTLVSK